jgi:hypothetical protein
MSNEAPAPKDLLTGSSAPTASFDDRTPGITVGTYYEGKVISEEVSQQTKPVKQGETPVLLFWDEPTNNRPKWQMVLTIQNNAYADADNPEGHLRVFLKGGALMAAQAKAKELGVESFLHGFARLTWIGTKPAKTPGFNDAKTYQFDFAPGVPDVQAQLLGGGQAAAPAFAPPVAQAAPGMQTQFPPAAQAAANPAAFTAPQQPVAAPAFAPPQTQQQVFPPALPPTTLPAAAIPAQQAPGDAAAAILGMGGVEVTPLPPETAAQVVALRQAGLSDQQVVEAFAKYNITVSLQQLANVPF